MDKSIEKLKALLELEENGGEIAEDLANILVDERKKSLFKAKLEEIKKELATSAQEVKLTPMEEAVRDMVLGIRMPVTAQEVSEKIGDRYPSLKYRTHASAALNSLVSKGILGKFKVGYSYYFTSPKEAVMELMKRRGEELGKCSPAEIAKETGMPLSKVLSVIEELSA
ncbi:MAG: hypothetical protein KKD69_02095 [Euryarchaeota archaeon]|nr:hypothetical protein [Euryarchaeota archaeon]MBU4491232.1 hypothetical protein [Euryarchaeota archaeon]MCG2727744.1 hypothetical protein [Candidatus Methanoperedenaceae archaeon]